MKNYLNFENEIKDLETELDQLKDPFNKEGLTEVDTKKILNTQNIVVMIAADFLPSLFDIIGAIKRPAKAEANRGS